MAWISEVGARISPRSGKKDGWKVENLSPTTSSKPRTDVTIERIITTPSSKRAGGQSPLATASGESPDKSPSRGTAPSPDEARESAVVRAHLARTVLQEARAQSADVDDDDDDGDDHAFDERTVCGAGTECADVDDFGDFGDEDKRFARQQRAPGSADEASSKVWGAYQRWRVTKIRLGGIKLNQECSEPPPPEPPTETPTKYPLASAFAAAVTSPMSTPLSKQRPDREPVTVYTPDEGADGTKGPEARRIFE